MSVSCLCPTKKASGSVSSFLRTACQDKSRGVRDGDRRARRAEMSAMATGGGSGGEAEARSVCSRSHDTGAHTRAASGCLPTAAADDRLVPECAGVEVQQRGHVPQQLLRERGKVVVCDVDGGDVACPRKVERGWLEADEVALLKVAGGVPVQCGHARVQAVWDVCVCVCVEGK